MHRCPNQDHATGKCKARRQCISCPAAPTCYGWGHRAWQATVGALLSTGACRVKVKGWQCGHCCFCGCCYWELPSPATRSGHTDMLSLSVQCHLVYSHWQKSGLVHLLIAQQVYKLAVAPVYNDAIPEVCQCHDTRRMHTYHQQIQNTRRVHKRGMKIKLTRSKTIGYCLPHQLPTCRTAPGSY